MGRGLPRQLMLACGAQEGPQGAAGPHSGWFSESHGGCQGRDETTERIPDRVWPQARVRQGPEQGHRSPRTGHPWEVPVAEAPERLRHSRHPGVG